MQNANLIVSPLIQFLTLFMSHVLDPMISHYDIRFSGSQRNEEFDLMWVVREAFSE